MIRMAVAGAVEGSIQGFVVGSVFVLAMAAFLWVVFNC